MKGQNLIGAMPEQHAPSVTRVIQNSFKYATLQAIKSGHGFAGNLENQFNINPAQIRLVRDVTASGSVISFEFGNGIKYEKYESGLGNQDAFVPTGIALRFGIVANKTVIGNETLVQNANPTTFAGNSGADAKAVKAFLSGKFELRADNEETIYEQSTTVLNFLETFTNTEGVYRLGDTTFHELLKTVMFSGSQLNVLRVEASGSIASIPSNLVCELVLDGFILRRKSTPITRQA